MSAPTGHGTACRQQIRDDEARWGSPAMHERSVPICRQWLALLRRRFGALTDCLRLKNAYCCADSMFFVCEQYSKCICRRGRRPAHGPTASVTTFHSSQPAWCDRCQPWLVVCVCVIWFCKPSVMAPRTDQAQAEWDPLHDERNVAEEALPSDLATTTTSLCCQRFRSLWWERPWEHLQQQLKTLVQFLILGKKKKKTSLTIRGCLISWLRRHNVPNFSA